MGEEYEFVFVDGEINCKQAEGELIPHDNLSEMLKRVSYRH